MTCGGGVICDIASKKRQNTSQRSWMDEWEESVLHTTLQFAHEHCRLLEKSHYKKAMHSLFQLIIFSSFLEQPLPYRQPLVSKSTDWIPVIHLLFVRVYYVNRVKDALLLRIQEEQHQHCSSQQQQRRLWLWWRLQLWRQLQLLRWEWLWMRILSINWDESCNDNPGIVISRVGINREWLRLVNQQNPVFTF